MKIKLRKQPLNFTGPKGKSIKLGPVITENGAINIIQRLLIAQKKFLKREALSAGSVTGTPPSDCNDEIDEPIPNVRTLQ